MFGGKKLLLFFLLFMTYITTHAQNVVHVSVVDLSPNYGIESSFLTDTNNIHQHLSHIAPNLALRECEMLNTQLQNMSRSLRNDYTVKDGKIWIDNNVVVEDFPKYDSIIQTLISIVHRTKTQIEHQRYTFIDTAELAKQRITEEQQRTQDNLNERATQLKDSIMLMHQKIFTLCDRKDSKNRKALKERKDLFYAYLTIYNKQNLTSTIVSDIQIVRLKDLLKMQCDLYNNVIGDNGYLRQIDKFNATLKDKAGVRNLEVYRSYIKNFPSITIAVNFTNYIEYYRYSNALRDITDVQNGYLKTIELRDSIKTNYDSIKMAYRAKKLPICKAYEYCLSQVNQIPTFTATREKDIFINHLRSHILLQKKYISNHHKLVAMESLGDSISKACKNLRDVKKCYAAFDSPYLITPTFCDTAEAAQYDSTLAEYRSMQHLFQIVINLTNEINQKEKLILSAKNAEKEFTKGYKNIKKQYELTPTFLSIKEGEQYTKRQQAFLYFQDKCLLTIAQSDTIADYESKIKAQEQVYPNIIKAYKLIRKDMAEEGIVTSIDMTMYQMRMSTIIHIQENFLNILKSADSKIIDAKLDKESDINVIRTIFQL